MIINFFTNRSRNEELQTLKLTMKKVHSRILQENMDLTLLEEFSKVLAEYEQTKTETKSSSPKEKAQEIDQDLDLHQHRIQFTYRKDKRRGISESWSNFLQRL